MELRIIPVRGLPEVAAGADLGEMIARVALAQPEGLQDGDVVVVTQKIVSKAEGRLIDPATVVPTPFAHSVAAQVDKDPHFVEAVLRESKRMVRLVPGTLIMETKHGHVCANAGIDHSNIPGGMLCLLPIDPDASARAIRERVFAAARAEVAVIISDTFGRAWRMGQTNVAIGVAGMLPLNDYRGQNDTFGVELRVTEIAVADELAGAAELVMGKLDQVPVAIIRGYRYQKGEGTAAQMVRSADKDLFR